MAVNVFCIVKDILLGVRSGINFRMSEYIAAASKILFTEDLLEWDFFLIAQFPDHCLTLFFT